MFLIVSNFWASGQSQNIFVFEITYTSNTNTNFVKEISDLGTTQGLTRRIRNLDSSTTQQLRVGTKVPTFYKISFTVDLLLLQGLASLRMPTNKKFDCSNPFNRL